MMAKNSRLFSLLLFSIISTSLLQPITIRAHRWHTASVFLLSSCLLSYNKDKAAASAFTQKIAHATNTDSQDLVDATTLGLYYWAWSFFFNDTISNAGYPQAFANLINITNKAKAQSIFNWRYESTMKPLIQIVATSKSWNTLIKKLPLINKLACSDPECAGVCDSCEYKHLMRKAPFEFVYPLIKHVNDTPAIDSIGSVQDQCPVCLENTLVIPICTQSPLHKCCLTCLPGIQQNTNCCPLCNFPLLVPGQGNPNLLPDASYSAKNVAWRMGFLSPLWVLLRRNNIFIYRWIMALYSLNPLRYRHTTCPNSSCISLCNQCKLKKLYA